MVLQRYSRQTEIETDRLDALAGGEHAPQQSIEQREGRRRCGSEEVQRPGADLRVHSGPLLSPQSNCHPLLPARNREER
jgi:hypothetical protein